MVNSCIFNSFHTHFSILDSQLSHGVSAVSQAILGQLTFVVIRLTATQNAFLTVL